MLRIFTGTSPTSRTFRGVIHFSHAGASAADGRLFCHSCGARTAGDTQVDSGGPLSSARPEPPPLLPSLDVEPEPKRRWLFGVRMGFEVHEPRRRRCSAAGGDWRGVMGVFHSIQERFFGDHLRTLVCGTYMYIWDGL